MSGLQSLRSQLPKVAFAITLQASNGSKSLQFEKELVMKTHVDVAPGNAQIFKPAADQYDLGLGLPIACIMNGSETRYDAVRRDDIEYVETFDCGGHLSCVGYSGLAIGVFHFHFAAHHVCVPGFEGNEVVKPEIVYARIANPAGARQDGWRLHLDHALEWPPELSA